jgi:hypothetical protein
MLRQVRRLGYSLDDPSSIPRKAVVFFATTSRLAMGPTQFHPVGSRVLSSGIKQLGNEANHSPLSWTKVKNM